jgi:hypothetical protein
MEDYEPEEIAEMVEFPNPAFGEVNYFRDVTGEQQQWITPVQAAMGVNQIVGPGPAGEDYVERQPGSYGVMSGPASREGSRTKHFVMPQHVKDFNASGKYSKGGSEFYQQRTDAILDNVRNSLHGNEDYFNREVAVYD